MRTPAKTCDPRPSPRTEDPDPEASTSGRGAGGAARRFVAGIGIGPVLVALLALSGAPPALAAGGPLGIDHPLAHDDHGLWSRRNQLAIEYGVIAFEVGGALWLGDGDAFGHTLWQTADASAASAVATQVLKVATGRSRPGRGAGPNAWFHGSGNRSFPSGEVALQASFVTPIIVNHADRNPWVWALELLPVYDGVARMKSRAHWQTDVLAGWALGTATGYLATRRQTPFFVQVLPRGLSVGYQTTF